MKIIITDEVGAHQLIQVLVKPLKADQHHNKKAKPFDNPLVDHQQMVVFMQHGE